MEILSSMTLCCKDREPLKREVCAGSVQDDVLQAWEKRVPFAAS